MSTMGGAWGATGASARTANSVGAMEPAARLRCSDAQVAVAARAAGDTLSHAGSWFWGAVATVVLWSVTYLMRQPGAAATTLDTPFSLFGSFALEGMVLSLAWLLLLAAASLALLTGVARFEDPSA